MFAGLSIGKKGKGKRMNRKQRKAIAAPMMGALEVIINIVGGLIPESKAAILNMVDTFRDEMSTSGEVHNSVVFALNTVKEEVNNHGIQR